MFTLTGLLFFLEQWSKTSYHNEHAELVRGIKKIKDSGLKMEVFISDRHVQNRKWIKEELPETKHYFDIWHVAKGTLICQS